MKILFVQTAHSYQDDRVWFHQRRSLIEAGDNVNICSTLGCRCLLHKWITIRRALRTYSPDIILADTPIAILLCYRKRKIVWDITEFYPSKKDMHGSIFKRTIQKIIKTRLAQLASLRCQAFIYGEESKFALYKNLPQPRLYLPYYPSVDFVPYVPAEAPTDYCRILYAGPKTIDKGWNNVQAAFARCKEKMPNINWQLDTMSQVPFETFCEHLKDYDLFLDLRQIDDENTQCMPIKLFYYLAAGRPSVYSQLEAIEQTIPNVQSCITLVQPNDYEQVAAAIMQYVQHQDLYSMQARQCRQLYLSRFTWEFLSPKLIDFLHEL